MVRPFSLDWGNVLRHFLLVNPLTLMARAIFCYLIVDSPCFYRISYLIYYHKLHFNWTTHSYYTKLGSLSSNEVTMKEEMQSWFQGIGHEDGFNPSVVPLADVRKLILILS